MRTHIVPRLCVASVISLACVAADAKDEPAASLAARTATVQLWSVEVDVSPTTYADVSSAQVGIVDRVVSALNLMPDVRFTFPRKSGRSGLSIPLAEPITRQVAGAIFRELRAIPGVASVSMRSRSELDELATISDSRQAVGLILSVGLSAQSLGAVEGGTLTNAGLAHLRTISGHQFPSARPLAGGMIALKFASELASSSAIEVAALVKGASFVDWVEPDYVSESLLVPNDTFYSYQWNLQGTWGINGPQAWDITTGSPTVNVAVIDTGILKSQPDLSPKIVGGYDMITDPARARDGNGPDGDASDEGNWSEIGDCGGTTFRPSSWHGSHVAGILAAASNNDYGVAGVAWGVRVVPVRVLGRCGGVRSDIINGMYWAAGLAVPGIPTNPTPARILNMSLGSSVPTPTCSASYQTAIDAVNATGAMIVVAAGNNGQTIGETGFYEPSGCSGVMTVAATDHLGFQSSYSNFSNSFKVDISAPGGDSSYYGDQTTAIYSTWDAGTRQPSGPTGAWKNGTSMAAPHVSGILALMLSARPTLSRRQLGITLIETSREFNSTSVCYRDSYCGWGIANAHAALLRATTDPANDYTEVTISSSINPVVVGNEYVLTATVTPSNVTGNVTFLDGGGNSITGCANVPVATGKATCRVSNAPVNTAGYTLSVVYNGDYTHHWAYSNTVVQVVLPTSSPPPSGSQTAIEYYHAAFDHYFITTIADEIAKLDNGTFIGWARTGQSFKVYPLNYGGGANVCRFFSTSFAPKSSHFYTPSANECATVKNNSNWQFEAQVFSFVLPIAGSCALGTEPLFRLYNNGQGAAPNHRYTTNLATRSAMIGKGWISEGAGSLGVIGCVPI